MARKKVIFENVYNFHILIHSILKYNKNLKYENIPI